MTSSHPRAGQRAACLRVAPAAWAAWTWTEIRHFSFFFLFHFFRFSRLLEAVFIPSQRSPHEGCDLPDLSIIAYPRRPVPAAEHPRRLVDKLRALIAGGYRDSHALAF